MSRNEACKPLWEDGPRQRRQHGTKQEIQWDRPKQSSTRSRVTGHSTYPVGVEPPDRGKKFGKNFYLEGNDLAI